MNIEQLHIGMTVVEVSPFGRETIPMQVVGIFQDGTVYLDFEGNEGDVWEVNIKDLKLAEEGNEKSVQDRNQG
ncbi:hypothetical protein [Butyricimonas faecihominis]|uniref:hypothetical protein n=1 Tax=Butyricimonas faecihominis TaxID=1472416 RepID=UPI0026DC1334|nr:hypothetical protein [Butyricimonas faecihominis]